MSIYSVRFFVQLIDRTPSDIAQLALSVVNVILVVTLPVSPTFFPV